MFILLAFIIKRKNTYFIDHMIRKSDTWVQVRGVSQSLLLIFAVILPKLSSKNIWKVPTSNEHMSLLTAMDVREVPGQDAGWIWWM